MLPVLVAPLVRGRAAHAVLAAYLGGGHTALHLAQDSYILLLCETCNVHRNLLVHPAEKILRPHPLKIEGITVIAQFVFFLEETRRQIDKCFYG